MSKMLINGGYYSWDQLIDFFIGFLKPEISFPDLPENIMN